MVRVIDEEESKKRNKQAFDSLFRGTLFYIYFKKKQKEKRLFGVKRFFIALTKKSEAEWLTVELSHKNIQLLLAQKNTKTMVVHLHDIAIIHILQKGEHNEANQ